MDEISKKDLLVETGISYGQLYRWKREGLIPEEWFVKRAAFTGQETWFPRERILERVGMILEMKDEQSLEEIRRQITGTSDGELEGLIHEAILMAKQVGISAKAVLFETNDGKHFLLFAKGGSVFSDEGVRTLKILTEKQVHERIKAFDKETDEAGGTCETGTDGTCETGKTSETETDETCETGGTGEKGESATG